MKSTCQLAVLLLATTALAAAESTPFLIQNEAEFKKCVAADARVKKLAGDMGFTEGPAWHPDGFLVFSDIPKNELKKWTTDGALTTFRQPSQNINGNTIDLQGRLMSAAASLPAR